MQRFMLLALFTGLWGLCLSANAQTLNNSNDMREAQKMANTVPKAGDGGAFALFAGGCFWCMEAEFSHFNGVTNVTSGYAGGEEGAQPTYDEVATGRTGFKEAISVTYDPAIISYTQLLDIFWSNVDPFDERGQFCDKGEQYKAAIFVSSPEEQTQAEESLKKIEGKFGRKVATQILPQMSFFEAEDYHQNYYEKNKERYEQYKNGCGRPEKLKELWGDKGE